MSWRDRITVEGQFRGVRFYYGEVSGEIGRRTTLKEFPGRDKPFVEDLGRRARRFSFDLFVLGEDYDIARDRLRAALETPGPGELIHPYWGTMTVTVEGAVRVRESSTDHGIARFEVTFVEAGDDLSLVQAPDTAAAVIEAAQKTETTLAEQFAAVFDVTDVISSVADDAVTMVNDACSALNTVRGKIAAALQVVDDAKAAIDAVTDTATSLVQTPTSLVNSLVDVYNSVFQGINSVTDAFEDLVEFFGTDGEDAVAAAGSILSSSTRIEVLSNAVTELSSYGDSFATLPENTAQQERSAENQRQFVRFVKTTVAIEASLVVSELEFENLTQAEAVRTLIVDLIDEILEDDALSDELYSPLTTLRATLVEHLSQAANALPELDDYTPQTSLPALVIAHQVYGDSRRESEILARNPQIRNPTAVPGGVTIKVLSDE